MNTKYHTSTIKSLSPENLEVILQAIARLGNDEKLLARYFECYRQAYAAALAAELALDPAALSPCGSAQSNADRLEDLCRKWDKLKPCDSTPSCHEGYWTEFSTANPRPDRWKGVETAKKDQNDSSAHLRTVHGQAEAWIRLASLCLCLCLMESYRPPGKNACEQIENYVRELYAGTYGPDALARRDEEMNRQ